MGISGGEWRNPLEASTEEQQAALFEGNDMSFQLAVNLSFIDSLVPSRA